MCQSHCSEAPRLMIALVVGHVFRYREEHILQVCHVYPESLAWAGKWDHTKVQKPQKLQDAPGGELRDASRASRHRRDPLRCILRKALAVNQGTNDLVGSLWCSQQHCAPERLNVLPGRFMSHLRTSLVTCCRRLSCVAAPRDRSSAGGLPRYKVHSAPIVMEPI